MPTQFEPGAAPAEGVIPLCVPEIRGNEWRYVKECLDTGWVSSVGSYVDRFERAVADYVGTKHAVAMVNGTAALHVALLVAGVQPDDEVLVSTLTFIAPANAIRYVGARPVFIDAEPHYWQMDPQRVADFLGRHCERKGGALRNKKTGRRVRALLPVDVLGHPADLDALRDLARRYELVFIEDSTESLGARYRGRKVGADADIACFSFNGNKLLTTGGGGMLVTDDTALAERAKYLGTQAKDDPLEYVHGAVGYNYRLTNVQAAIGCAQMELLEEYVGAKRRIADRYRSELAELPGISVMQEASWAHSTHWMFTVLIDSQAFGLDSRAVLAAMTRDRIQTRPVWQPLHLSPAHAGALAVGGEVAERIHRDALSLPCSVGLVPEQQQRVISALRSYVAVTS
jgi:perosamine synthetase